MQIRRRVGYLPGDLSLYEHMTAEDHLRYLGHLRGEVLPQVEALCDRVGIIREGHLVAVEHIAALKDRAIRYLELHFARAVPDKEFRDLPGVRDVSTHDSVVRCTVVGDLDAVIKAAARFPVVNVVSHEPSLEDIFLAYYGEPSDAP